MKEINLISLVSAHSKAGSDLFIKYLDYHQIDFKLEEVNDLKEFVTYIRDITKTTSIFDKYFIGYSIPQISKEFDLLRIGEQSIVNIELKSIADKEKIKKQLIRNKYYLSFLDRELHLFTFAAKTKKLFFLNEKDDLIEVSGQNLIGVLKSQVVDNIKDINSLFNPSNYLVSPFNSTEQFILNKYFLTKHQEKIKKEVLDLLNANTGIFLSIKGKAGTGKTLLTYDIAKELMALNKRVVIVHCGMLNQGHFKLSMDFKWDIIPAKSISSIYFSQCDLIIIDEAQRIYPESLIEIIQNVKAKGGRCIFSYDGQQCLSSWEIQNKIEEQIEQVIFKEPFELTTKIRSNKEIADFLTCFFDNRKPIVRKHYPNIELNYFNSHEDAKAFLMQKTTDDWKVINYTPNSRHTHPYERYKIFGNDNAHTVIGQEFDNVLAVVDEFFYYKTGKLSTKDYEDAPYYHPTKMLFQMVTRTRLKLGIVLVNNTEILEHCLNILNEEAVPQEARAES